MKSIFSLIAIIACSALGYAETETVGDYTWRYRINGDTAEIYGIYSKWNKIGCIDNPTGSVTIPSVLGGKQVTSVGEYSFYNCENITDLTIPESVTNIGEYAFYKCTKLQSVNIPDDVTKIGSRAFYECSSLTRVSIPKGVTKIEERTFYECSSLRGIVIPEGVTRIETSAFERCFFYYEGVIIPSSVEYIGYWAFTVTSSCFFAFKGDAPTYPGSDLSSEFGSKYGCSALVTPVSVGWNVTIPGNWGDGNLGIRYLCAAKFNANGGVVDAPDRYLAPGESVGTLPIPNRTGHTFNGWYTAASGGERVSSTTKLSKYQNNTGYYNSSYVDATYYAQWTINQYNIVFDANGGSGGTSVRQDYGTVITIPDVMRTGYSFDGWMPSVASTVPANDVTYVAQWNPIVYTIVYDANGGEGTTASTAATYDEDATISANGFANYAKQFAGWATETGGEVVYRPGDKVKNLTADADGIVTLYAVWEPLVVPLTEVSAVDGTEFCGESYTVDLSCSLDGATIYYTTNGVTPRLSAAFEYKEPIVIYGSANIVAIAVKDGVRSDYTRVSIVQITPEEPEISPSDGTEFRSETCEVTISCATDGAEIYYTLDGSTPEKESGIKYTEPFTIGGTTTIKAIAIGGPLKSEVVTATISKRSLPLAEAAGVLELKFDTDENAPWRPIVDASAEIGFAAQSGAIGMSASTWMETSVRGAGEFSFRWRVECEEDDSGYASWDRLMVFTNGIEAARIDGVKDWLPVTFAFGDNGKHTVRWEFVKDDYDEEDDAFADSGWVSGVSWVSDDPIPEIEEDLELPCALIQALDKERLLENISNASEYMAFRWWVDGKGIEHMAVADSPNAWVSYALDAPGLMAKETPIAREDIEIESLVGSEVSAGALDLVVGIDGVEIGEGARLAEALGIEGATELKESAFSAKNLEVALERTADGKAKATVTPNGTPSTFFIRVKVK